MQTIKLAESLSGILDVKISRIIETLNENKLSTKSVKDNLSAVIAKMIKLA